MSPSSLLILSVIILLVFSKSAGAQRKFPAIFIYGDSLLDTGNNNYVNTLLKANHVPYGIDFPGRVPTGRFSNGKLMSDMLAAALGIKQTVPPFLDPSLSNSELSTGVCFASAGSGYDDMTTALSGAIAVSHQPSYFPTYLQRLQSVVGQEQASSIVNSSLVVVSSGSNDFFAFYASPTMGAQYGGAGGYQDFLLQQLQNFVKKLYSFGLRNVVLFGIPPIGDAQTYNQKLAALLSQLQSTLPGSKLVYGDLSTPMVDIAINPMRYGFLVPNVPCCSGLCAPGSPVCPSPNQYTLWDTVHPTEAVYKIITQSLLEKSISQF